MGLKDLLIKPSYRSAHDDFAVDFFIPTLSVSSRYDRAVGFFSSTSLAQVTRGLFPFFMNGGHLRIVASPHMSEDDYQAIESGYKKRAEIIEDSLLRTLLEPRNDEELDRLNLLANMIASNLCDIKIAIMDASRGIYHEKIGLISDNEFNTLAFTGSLNETGTALNENFESIDVFTDWKNDSDADRVLLKKEAFESLWNNQTKGVHCFEFSSISRNIVEKYLRRDRELKNSDKPISLFDSNCTNKGPSLPSWLKLHDYQKKAVDNFIKNNGTGLFDMATGTGKTLTALSAMTALSIQLNHVLGVIIVVPYVHLVTQWIEDIHAFGIKRPIIAFSETPQKDWQSELRSGLRDLSFNISNPFFCCITTTATFSTLKFQNIIQKANGLPLLLIGDEAHNLGSTRTKKYLIEIYKYRLGLSATLERHHDKDGTILLERFFGERCIYYDLERAILEKHLTPYEYYPVFVTMNEEERRAYVDLSRKIGKALASSEHELSPQAQNLLIERSRLIANIQGKINALNKSIEPFINSKNILIYCGASATFTTELPSLPDSYAEIAQISQVVSLLSNKGMLVSTFTSSKNNLERDQIKKAFAEGDIQALVAIKCLDEGVNITGIQKAFILASSTNPKEYIQRRGRVLRLSPNKDKAEIYDYIVLPYDITDSSHMTFEELKHFRRHVANELIRYKEFARLSLNKTYSGLNFHQLCNHYQLDPTTDNLLGDSNEF